MKHSWNEEEQGRGIMADRFDLDAIEADDALLDLLHSMRMWERTAELTNEAIARYEFDPWGSRRITRLSPRTGVPARFLNVPVHFGHGWGTPKSSV